MPPSISTTTSNNENTLRTETKEDGKASQFEMKNEVRATNSLLAREGTTPELTGACDDIGSVEPWLCSSCTSMVNSGIEDTIEKLKGTVGGSMCAICIGLSDRITSIAHLCASTITDPCDGFQYDRIRFNPIFDLLFELRERLWVLNHEKSINNLASRSIVNSLRQRIILAANKEMERMRGSHTNEISSSVNTVDDIGNVVVDVRVGHLGGEAEARALLEEVLGVRNKQKAKRRKMWRGGKSFGSSESSFVGMTRAQMDSVIETMMKVGI
jgi:hypothetical protein